MTIEQYNNLKKTVGIFALTVTVLFGTLIFMMLRGGGVTEKEKPAKLTQSKSQPKDTTTYHFSDDFTDAQLREMVRSGHLRLR